MTTTVEDFRAWLPDYDVGEEIGRGGFGVVRAGCHRHLKRNVAIKQLPAALVDDPVVRNRFAAEARVLALLSHAHIVPIYDFVERERVCLLVMENLPGGTVWSRAQEGGFSLSTACAIVMATCAGLHYAHERNVLHRDIKPENVLFSSEGVLKITDFGIAKVVGGAETLATRAGEIMGTPAYIAPEQAEGVELGPPADVYAAGVMLYELVSGHLPFPEEGGALAIVYRHVYESPIPLEQVAPDAPRALIDVTMRALSRAPADRYQTAEAFGVAIGEAMTGAMGTGWLARSEIRVADGGRIAATDQLVVPAPPQTPADDGRTTRRRVKVPPASARPSGPIGAPPVPADPAMAPPAARGPSTRVRPKVSAHVGGADAANLSEDNLVPVHQAIELPPPPFAQAAAVLVLAVVMVAVAFVGLGSSPLKGDIAPGTATVAGKDPTAAGTIELDLDKPVEIRLDQIPPAAGAAPRVQLGFLAGTIPLPGSDAVQLDLVPGPAGAMAVGAVDATTSRYLVAGKMRGELRILADETTVQSQQFEAKSTQPSLLTVPGVLTVALLLFLLAYAESLLRPLRRGRRQITGMAGLIVVGAGFGVVAVLFAWLARVREPTIATIIVCMVLGAGAGVAAALAGRAIGRRAAIRPKRRQVAVDA